MTEVDVKKIHVDRTNELKLFDEMLVGASSPHILLIQAEAGMGKTSLLQEFWSRCGGMVRARVNLKHASYTVSQILGLLCKQLGEEQFRTYYEKRDNLLRPADVNIAIAHSNVSGSVFDVQGQAAREQRDERNQVLTEAFVKDLAAAGALRGGPFVLIFDTFEAASPEVAGWISGLLLQEIKEFNWLTLVAAGKVLPELDDWEWGDWCLRRTLQPLGQAEIKEYLERFELVASEDMILLLYISSKGKPLKLSTDVGQYLLELAKRGGETTDG